MQNYNSLLKALYEHDPLMDFYDANKSAFQERAKHVVKSFGKRFGVDKENIALFSGPGRTEIGGNHTDHQHGHVLCASVNLDILGCAAPNNERVIRIFSEGFTPDEVEIGSLFPREEERGCSQSIVRGIASKITELGYPLRGIDVYTISDVLSGSGLSSSAAFETLIGNVLNYFCCNGELNAVEIAKIGQFAENVYFGKPCGLMDQMASSVGGAVAIDFRDPSSPVVERTDYVFAQSGHTLCIIDTGSSHADLTDEYAAIPREMCEVAAYFGKSVLREVDEADFLAAIPALREKCGDRAVLRAMHFFGENKRAAMEAEALKHGDFAEFLRLVNESGASSTELLQNTHTADSRNQAVSLAIALGKRLLGGEGAVRVHGGGFAGTVQAWVPDGLLEGFRRGMEAVFGEGKCHVLHIRPQGGCVIGG